MDFAFAFEEIFANKIYEQQIPPGGYILDCGANIGLSVIYLNKIAPDAVIEAFEPDLKNFSFLERNMRAFKINNIQLHKAAVWKENTTLSFSSEGSMSSKINNVYETGTETGTIVNAVRLRDYLIRKVDFLKMDIEGAEYEVLKDIADRLHFVMSMFVEYHGTFSQNRELLHMLEIIEKAGFSFYIKEAAVLFSHPFTKRAKHQNVWDVQLNIFCIRL